MPFIPLPQNAPMADAPVPVLNRQQAPTGNLAGVQQGLGRLAAASQSDMIPIEPFTAPGRGMQAIGEGVQSFAGVFAKLAEVKAEAKNDLDAATATNALDLAYADFEKAKQTLPPDRWEDEWNQRSGAAISGVMQNDGLAPATRRRLELYGQKWTGQTAVRVARDATLTIGQRAEDELFSGLERDQAAGNYDAVDLKITEAEKSISAGRMAYVDRGKLTHARIVNQKMREQAEKDAEWNAEAGKITENPDGYLAENSGKREDETPSEHARRINYAQELARDSFHARTADIADALADPKLTPDALESKLQGLRPAEAAKWRDAYADSQNSKRQAELAQPEYINKLWGTLDDAVQDFDREDENARENYTAIRAAAMQLPEGWRQHVLHSLDGKWFAKQPEPSDAIKTEIMDAIEGAYKEGGFGAVTKPVQEGRDPVTGQWEPARPGVTYAARRTGSAPVDEKALEGPRAAKASLKIQMLELLKKNPNWTPEDAFAALNTSRERQRSKAAPAINFTAPAGLQPPPDESKKKRKAETPTGAANNLDFDLPGGGGAGEYDSILLPPNGALPPPR
jgi:hypothetical protein